MRARASGRSAALASLLLAVAPASAAALDGVADVADRARVELSAGAIADPVTPVLALSASRFLGDLVQVGVRQEGGFDAASGDHAWHLATLPFVDLHLSSDPKPLLTPFVGFTAGALYDADAVTATLGPEAGVELFLGEDVVVALRWQYRWATGRVARLDRDAHVATLGVGYLFPPPLDEDALRAQQAAERAEQAALAAEQAVERLEKAVERLEKAVDAFAIWFKEQLEKR